MPQKPDEQIIDFGILSATETSTIMFAVLNSNPIQVRTFLPSFLLSFVPISFVFMLILSYFSKLFLKGWNVIGDGLTVELLAAEKGNRTTIIASLPDLEKARILDQTSVSYIFLEVPYYLLYLFSK